MQKKSNKFLKKEIEKFRDMNYIEGLTFEQIKKLSVGDDDYHIN